MDELVDAYFLSEDDPPQEASAWLKAGAGHCTLGELATTSSSLRLVKAVYKAGAVKVWAVAIDRYPDGSENTGKLVIELPHDHEARMSILKWVSRKIHSIPPEGFPIPASTMNLLCWTKRPNQSLQLTPTRLHGSCLRRRHATATAQLSSVR